MNRKVRLVLVMGTVSNGIKCDRGLMGVRIEDCAVDVVVCKE